MSGLVRCWRVALLLLVLPVLQACTTGAQASLGTFNLLNPWADPTAGVRLEPSFTYLRVTANGTPSLFVLGYVDDSGPLGQAESVWYSRSGEMLRTRNGRLIAMVGTPEELASTQFNDPVWDWPRSQGVQVYQRVRQVSRPSAYGLQESVTLQRPTSLRPQHYKSPPTASYRWDDIVWYAETYEVDSPLMTAARPSLFGVVFTGQQGRVVYSEQCPTPSICLSLQEWPSQ